MNYAQARNGIRSQNGPSKDMLGKPGHMRQESLEEAGRRIQKRTSKFSNINSQLCNGAWGLSGATGIPEKKNSF